jgi:hypothetical protein
MFLFYLFYIGVKTGCLLQVKNTDCVWEQGVGESVRIKKEGVTGGRRKWNSEKTRILSSTYC